MSTALVAAGATALAVYIASKCDAPVSFYKGKAGRIRNLEKLLGYAQHSLEIFTDLDPEVLCSMSITDAIIDAAKRGVKIRLAYDAGEIPSLLKQLSDQKKLTIAKTEKMESAYFSVADKEHYTVETHEPFANRPGMRFLSFSKKATSMSEKFEELIKA